MSVPLVENPVVESPALAPPSPLKAESQSNYCGPAIKKIAEIALRILSVVATVFLLSLLFPASVNPFFIPIASIVGIVGVLLSGSTEDEPLQSSTPVLAPIEPPREVPAVQVPSGIRNASGVDCWLNSITQIIRMDKNMREWFENVPSRLNTHLEWLPILSQEVLENLPADLPLELLDRVEVERRGAFNEYIQSIRNMEPEKKQNLWKYLRFLREKDNPETVVLALAHLKYFCRCYTRLGEPGGPVMRPARGGRPAQLYTNERLRVALSQLSPLIFREAIQQDAANGVRVIQDLLLPEPFQLQIESWKYYDVAGKPPLVGDDVVDGHIKTKREQDISPIPLAMKGDHPNIQDLFHRFLKNRDLEGRIVADGYEYPLTKIENKLTHVPDSLWFCVNRQRMISSPWVGLHRLMPDWFDANAPREIKPETSVEAQEIIALPNGDRYKLDGFILHRGGDGAGHYISYVCKQDAEGNDVWFELNDSVVTRLTMDKMRKMQSQSLIYHYSKIEPVIPPANRE